MNQLASPMGACSSLQPEEGYCLNLVLGKSKEAACGWGEGDFGWMELGKWQLVAAWEGILQLETPTRKWGV